MAIATSCFIMVPSSQVKEWVGVILVVEPYPEAVIVEEAFQSAMAQLWWTDQCREGIEFLKRQGHSIFDGQVLNTDAVVIEQDGARTPALVGR